jgi:peptide deformylase
MTRLAILEYPDPRLRTRARPVRVFDQALERLVDDMFETMYEARGIGLAATQVDVHRQVVTIDVSSEKNRPEVFINPEILSCEVEGMVEESCLSLPGVKADVARAIQVRVRTQDRAGQSAERDLEGMLAVCLQHELDHLQGKLFVDRLSFFKRLRIRRQYRRDRHVAPHTTV